MDSPLCHNRPGGARRIASGWTKPRTPLYGDSRTTRRPLPDALYRRPVVTCKYFAPGLRRRGSDECGRRPPLTPRQRAGERSAGAATPVALWPSRGAVCQRGLSVLLTNCRLLPPPPVTLRRLRSLDTPAGRCRNLGSNVAARAQLSPPPRSRVQPARLLLAATAGRP